ncbi:MAG: diguanylate cyclase [Xanthomonadales bacterium]|nr:diguanylate cyclase [Xanthomonadales bacterium]
MPKRKAIVPSPCAASTSNHLKPSHRHAHGQPAATNCCAVFAKRLQTCGAARRAGGAHRRRRVRRAADRSPSPSLPAERAGNGVAICAAMAAPLFIGDRSLALATSIGIAVAKPDRGRDQLMSAADRALYAAKATPPHTSGAARPGPARARRRSGSGRFGVGTGHHGWCSRPSPYGALKVRRRKRRTQESAP